MPGSCILTVVTQSHIHTARALEASVRSFHPHIPFLVYLVDAPPVPLEWAPQPGAVISADEIGIPRWRRFAFQYEAFEAVCALKSFAISHALTTLSHTKVIYFDSDIQVYNAADGILDLLDRYDIVLTPHMTAPAPLDGLTPDDLSINTAGAYNAGFLACRRSDSSTAMLNWWQSKMANQCITDLPGHLYVDQSWLNLVPCLFEGVLVERDPGYNVACWNLHDRHIEFQADGRPTVNGKPLLFFHFTGFDYREPEVFSRKQERYKLADLPGVRELTRRYTQRILSCEPHLYEGIKYAFNTLSDGTPIQPTWREAIRVNYPTLADVTDPFDLDGTPDLVSRFRAMETAMATARMSWLFEKPMKAQELVASLKRSPLLGRLLRLYQWLGLIEW
jgi:hypothetical protein